MSFSVTCPECDSTQKVPDEAVGKRLRCKGCQAVFRAGNADVDIVDEGPPPARTSRARDDAAEPRPARRRPRDEDEADRPRRKVGPDEDDPRPSRRRDSGKTGRREQMSPLGLIALIFGVVAFFVSIAPRFAPVGIGAGALSLIGGVVALVLARSSGRQGVGAPSGAICFAVAAIAVGTGWMVVRKPVSRTVDDVADDVSSDFRRKLEAQLDDELAQERAVPHLAVTAVALTAAYQTDPAGSDTIYVRKPLEVTGVVANVERRDIGVGELILHLTGSDGATVACTFLGKDRAAVQGVAVGRSVTVRGMGAAMDGTVFYLNHCYMPGR